MPPHDSVLLNGIIDIRDGHISRFFHFVGVAEGVELAGVRMGVRPGNGRFRRARRSYCHSWLYLICLYFLVHHKLPLECLLKLLLFVDESGPVIFLAHAEDLDLAFKLLDSPLKRLFLKSLDPWVRGLHKLRLHVRQVLALGRKLALQVLQDELGLLQLHLCFLITDLQSVDLVLKALFLFRKKFVFKLPLVSLRYGPVRLLLELLELLVGVELVDADLHQLVLESHSFHLVCP